MMLRRTLAAVACATATLVTTSCAGPHAPLSVGMVQYGTDVQFGAEAMHAAPPVPPGALTLAPPSVGAPLIAPVSQPTPTPSATVAPPSCPPASPFAVALLAPTTTIAAPPKPATYTYRDTGGYSTSGAGPVTLPYPASSTRTVQHVATTKTGGFSFQVVNRMGQLVATTTYQYVPPEVGQVAESTPTAGLYITAIHQTDGKTTVSDFTATGPGLLLLQVPAIPGTSWTTSSTDATTGATIAAGVSEGVMKTVNACGDVIDALSVHVDGQIGLSQNAAGEQVKVPVPGPTPSGASNVEPVDNTSTTFTADYVLATQYGGISVMDTVDETGTEAGVGVNSHNVSTINSVPKTP